MGFSYHPVVRAVDTPGVKVKFASLLTSPASAFVLFCFLMPAGYPDGFQAILVGEIVFTDLPDYPGLIVL